jgi:hypothetical protein
MAKLVVPTLAVVSWVQPEPAAASHPSLAATLSIIYNVVALAGLLVIAILSDTVEVVLGHPHPVCGLYTLQLIGNNLCRELASVLFRLTFLPPGRSPV